MPSGRGHTISDRITMIADGVARMPRQEESGPCEARKMRRKTATNDVNGIAVDGDHDILILDFERLLHAS